MAHFLACILLVLTLSLAMNLVWILGFRTFDGFLLSSSRPQISSVDFPIPNFTSSDNISVQTRFPINQIDPVPPYGTQFSDPWSYFHTVKYCHHYPDIMCYLRNQRGFSHGDKYAWTLFASTDGSGLGALRVGFPPRLNYLDNDAHTLEPAADGLSYHGDAGALNGITVYLTSSAPSIRFQPGNSKVFVRNVPYDRWGQNLYVDFNGDPNRAYFFFLYREVHWAHDPIPPESPHSNDPDEGRHDDL